jgi:hypothetical protein
VGGSATATACSSSRPKLRGNIVSSLFFVSLSLTLATRILAEWTFMKLDNNEIN